MITSSEHRAVQRASKDNRNAGAKARRERFTDRMKAIEVIEVRLPDGYPLLFAISRAEPDRAYVLRPDPETGRWRCRCFTRQWGKAGTCQHETAAAAISPPTQNQSAPQGAHEHGD